MNFRFTQIPDKTNDMIFLKSKNAVFGPFLTIFGHFCPMSQFANFEKTYKQIEGQSKGQTDPIL